MRSGKRWNAVPDGSAARLIHASVPNDFEVPNGLRINVHLDTRPAAVILDLFDNAAFSTVTPVQKG